jgi:Putative peptidoglycan binding domain
MGLIHRTKPGECISSIAFFYGFHPDTLWDHPRNAGIREQRGDPNVLLAGDEVFVPDKRPREHDGVTGRRHRLRRKGVPEVYRARFIDRAGRPRAGLRYRFTSGEWSREGITDAEGSLEHWIEPDASRAELVLFDEGVEERYQIQLGHLDPITEVSGVQARLNSLGYPCGPVTGAMNERTAAALRRFQESHAIEATGEPDEPTRGKLDERYRA